MYEHALAHLQPGLRKERVVRRDKSFWDGCGFGPTQIFRNLCERRFRRDDVFTLRAAARDAEDARAHAKPSSLRPRFFDTARELKTGNVCGRTRRSRIETPSLKQVRAIESRRKDTHQHTVCRRPSGTLDLAHLQTLNPAVTRNHNGSHTPLHN